MEKRGPAAAFLLTLTAIGAIAIAGCGGSDSSGGGDSGLPLSKATQSQVSRGRAIVASFGCVDCHSQGRNDPGAPGWLSGYNTASGPHGPGVFQIGPFATYAANITPSATGLGGFTDRQVYNALKHGLDPGATADASISGDTPGQGGFPAAPHYLAPPMPWASIRHLSDDDLWSVVAYLKHGVKPVANTPPDSQGPPDFWASSDTADKIGPGVLPSYPAAGEQFTP